MAVCKQDCDYTGLIAANYTNDTQAFIINVVKTLPSEVGSTCGQTLSKYLNTGPVTTDSILSSLGENNQKRNKKLRDNELIKLLYFQAQQTEISVHFFNQVNFLLCQLLIQLTS